MPSVARVCVLLVVLVSGAFGQATSPSDASTVAPDDIFSLSEEDFQLWISGRQPKAWGSADGSGSNSLDTTSTSTTTTTTPRSTLPSVFRTTSTTTPSPPSAIGTTSTTPNPLDFFTTRPSGTPSDGKSWFEDDGSDNTVQPDILGDQFKPAGEDFAQWLERQMNRVQEVTFTLQTTLTGDPFPGLVTRLTTIRNRIPAPTTFAPSSAGSDAAVTLPPPTTTAPFPPLAPSTTFVTQQPASAQPVDLQKWLRDQLQLSQSLTDQLLAQWSPSGSFVRADGHSYQPTAVSYQTSALIHGLQGVSHSGQVRNDHNSPPLPFPGTSHTTDSYLSHQRPPVNTTPAPAAPIAIRHGQPAVFYPSGSFYYSQPAVPHYGAYVGGYRAPVVINYH
uniref:Uncharacterized protein n=1 Tax=Anopheles atroparvus TaxID=41427 RepID=A0AAG5DGA3_ANOAO